MLQAHQSDLVENGSLPLTSPTLLLSPLLSGTNNPNFKQQLLTTHSQVVSTQLDD